MRELGCTVGDSCHRELQASDEQRVREANASSLGRETRDGQAPQVPQIEDPDDTMDVDEIYYGAGLDSPWYEDLPR